MTRKKRNPGGKLLEALVSFDRDLLLELMRAALEEVLESEISEQFGGQGIVGDSRLSRGHHQQIHRLLCIRASRINRKPRG